MLYMIQKTIMRIFNIYSETTKINQQAVCLHKNIHVQKV